MPADPQLPKTSTNPDRFRHIPICAYVREVAIASTWGRRPCSNPLRGLLAGVSCVAGSMARAGGDKAAGGARGRGRWAEGGGEGRTDGEGKGKRARAEGRSVIPKARMTSGAVHRSVAGCAPVPWSMRAAC